MSGGNRKREHQKTMEQNVSDDEQSEHGSVESRELGGKRGSGKGQVKQNHSEIEKRRRDKMNTYINELSTLIPMCSVMSRKLDKLTVLRMAVQHMRTLKGEKSSPESNCKPSFLSDEDFKNLILESADGFLFVVACDRGRILYVSDSVQNIISQSQSDLVGQSFFDLVHPKDVPVVKEQLSCFDIVPRDKTAEKPLPQPKQENKQGSKSLCTGARRSFLCRMKSGTKSAKKTKGNDEESSSELCIMNKKSKNKALALIDKKKHVVVHFTGYLKSWPPSGYSFDEEDEDQDYRNMSCLVAVGREVKIDDKDTINTNPEYTKEFESRHDIDGKFIHVDQRVTSMCGYLPHELIGKSGYEYFHPDDLDIIADSHKSALQGKKPTTVPYRFLCKAGHYIYLCTKSNVFRNPWTKELEFIICINTKYNHKKDQETLSTQHLQSNPLPRFILPVPNPPNPQPIAGSSGGEASQGKKQSIRELMAIIQSQEQGKPNKQPSAGLVHPVCSEEVDPAADLSASKLGALIAETVKLQEATEKRQHTPTLDDSMVQSVSAGEQQSESSLRTIDSSGSLVDFSEIATPNKADASSSQGWKFPPPSTFLRVPTPGPVMPGLPEVSQPHLLEQLIGMQQAIESMESPMQQNEESMAVFMNMLEADAGLGGDLSDFLFPDGS